MEMDNELVQSMVNSLEQCSRQRVRSIQMSLRRIATDSRIKNERHIMTVLEENNIKFTVRTTKRLVVAARDQRGINVEIFVKYLKEAQKNTGRDSVEAKKHHDDKRPGSQPAESNLFWKTMFRTSATKIMNARISFSGKLPMPTPIVTPENNEEAGEPTNRRVPLLEAILQDPVNDDIHEEEIFPQPVEEEKEEVVSPVSESHPRSTPDIVITVEDENQNLVHNTTYNIVSPIPEAYTDTLVVETPTSELSHIAFDSANEMSPKPKNKQKKLSRKRTSSNSSLIKSLRNTNIETMNNELPANALENPKSKNQESNKLLENDDIKEHLPSRENIIEPEKTNEDIEEALLITTKEATNDVIVEKDLYADDLQESVPIETHIEAQAEPEMKDDLPKSRSPTPVLVEEVAHSIAGEEEHVLYDDDFSICTETTESAISIVSEDSDVDCEIIGDDCLVDSNPGDGSMVSTGDRQFLAYKPDWTKNREYLSVMHSNAATSEPCVNVEWVYGCKVSHPQCLASLSIGELIYSSGCVVVLYNHTRDTQRQYLEHSAEITCIAVHPNNEQIATAQTSNPVAMNNKLSSTSMYYGLPHVRVWDVEDLETRYVFEVGSSVSIIIKMQFLWKMNYFLTLEEDADGTLTLWDGGCKIKKMLLTPAILNMDKNNKENKKSTPINTTKAISFSSVYENKFTIAGKEYLSFWEISDLTNTTVVPDGDDTVSFIGPQRGEFDKFFRPRFVTCCKSINRGGTIGPCFVTGDTNGTLLVWSEDTKRAIAGAKHAHECSIASVFATKTHVFTGGSKDYTVKAFAFGKTDLSCVGNILLPQNVGNVITLAHCEDEYLYVSTSDNYIISVKLNHSAYTAVKSMTTDSLKPNESTKEPFFNKWDSTEIAHGTKVPINCVCHIQQLFTDVQNKFGSSLTLQSRRRKGSISSIRSQSSVQSEKPTHKKMESVQPVLRANERILKREQQRAVDNSEKCPVLPYSKENYIRMTQSNNFPELKSSKERSNETSYFASCSSDGWLIVYNAITHKIWGQYKLPYYGDDEVTSIAFSNRKYIIAIATKMGKLILLAIMRDKFEIISTIRFYCNDGKIKQSKCIQFSKNGRLLSVLLDKEVIVYTVHGTTLDEKLRCTVKLQDHFSLDFMDWSKSKHKEIDILLAGSSKAAECFYWWTDNGEAIEDISILRNIHWLYNASPINYCSKDIWKNVENLTQLKICGLTYKTKKHSESLNNMETKSNNRKNTFASTFDWRKSTLNQKIKLPSDDSLCISGDTSGRIHAKNYPAVFDNANTTIERCHVDAVSWIEPIESSSGFLTIAKNESIIAQWGRKFSNATDN